MITHRHKEKCFTTAILHLKCLNFQTFGYCTTPKSTFKLKNLRMPRQGEKWHTFNNLTNFKRLVRNAYSLFFIERRTFDMVTPFLATQQKRRKIDLFSAQAAIFLNQRAKHELNILHSFLKLKNILALCSSFVVEFLKILIPSLKFLTTVSSSTMCTT